MQSIGERVREARKEADMTQELLARHAGLSLNMLSRLELGKIQDPHISSLRQIAHAVGVPVEALIREEDRAEDPLPV